MNGYRLSNEAIKDLDDIWFYTCQKWSVEQADRYYYLIIDEIKFIASNPLTGRSVSYIKEGYRSTIIKSHVIFYRQIENDIILIVRILHQNMDIENRMK